MRKFPEHNSSLKNKFIDNNVIIFTAVSCLMIKTINNKSLVSLFISFFSSVLIIKLFFVLWLCVILILDKKIEIIMLMEIYGTIAEKYGMDKSTLSLNLSRLSKLYYIIIFICICIQIKDGFRDKYFVSYIVKLICKYF